MPDASRPEVPTDEIRRVLLETVDDFVTRMPQHMTHKGILGAAVQHLIEAGHDVRGDDRAEQTLLTLLYDLFRNGKLSWGLNLANPETPWCHLTAQGHQMLKQLSRDPSNPVGYLGHLGAIGAIPDIAMSYVEEALHTYNSGCFKAAAIMVGAAAELMALHLRDTLVSNIEKQGGSVRKELRDWRIKVILDGVRQEIESGLGNMPRELRDAYEANWLPFTHQVRTGRNEAGHPQSIEPVTEESVHAALLVFPMIAKVALDIEKWIGDSGT